MKRVDGEDAWIELGAHLECVDSEIIDQPDNCNVNVDGDTLNLEIHFSL